VIDFLRAESPYISHEQIAARNSFS